LNSKNVIIVAFGFLFLCLGCDRPTTDVPTAQARTPSELIDSLREEIKEFNFCLSEDAGIESLSGSVDRMKPILDALPDSVSAAGLPENDKQKLNQGITKLTAAHTAVADSVENNAAANMSEAIRNLASEAKVISKLL